MLYAPVLGMDSGCRNAACPAGRGHHVPRTTSGAHALIPETSIFSEWPVLFLSMGGTGGGSEAQKEASLVVFRAGHC